MLAVGLLTEALFFASAFEPVDNELDWSLVYPELATGAAGPERDWKTESADLGKRMLSRKLGC
jgi:gliding motility-associated protein GldL